MNNRINSMRLVVTIVDRNLSNKIVKAFEQSGSYFHEIIYGKGTAPKDIYEYLGFGNPEKAVILSVVPTDIVPFMLDILKIDFHFEQPGHGVACTIPLDSIAGKSALEEVLRNKKISQEDILSKITKEGK